MHRLRGRDDRRDAGRHSDVELQQADDGDSGGCWAVGLNGGAFDEDVSVLRVKTSANVETLSVTEDGEVWLGTSGRFSIGPPGDDKVYMDASGVFVVGAVDVSGRLSGEKYVTAMDEFGTIHSAAGFTRIKARALLSLVFCQVRLRG